MFNIDNLAVPELDLVMPLFAKMALDMPDRGDRVVDRRLDYQNVLPYLYYLKMKQSPITYNYPLRVSGNPLREMSNLGDELLDGLNEWRNVQDIVRLTFKGLSDVVKKQGIAIDEIQEQLNSKVNTSDIPKYVQSPGDTQISVENQDYINRVSRTDLNLLKQEIEEVKLGTIGHARASSQLSARAVDSEIQNL